MRVSQFQKLDKFRAAVTCTLQSQNRARQQVDARQKGECSVSDVLVVTPDRSMFSRCGWKVGCAVLDGLNPGFLVVGEYRHQIRRGCALLAPDLHFLINMQHLHYLGSELRVASLQVILNPGWPHLVCAEDLGDGSTSQLGKTRMSCRHALLADMLRQ